MNKQLDLSGVRIYKSEKQDIIDSMDLIDQECYMSQDENFKDYYKLNLVGIKYAKCFRCTFIGEAEDGEAGSYRYFILAKDAKFKEEPKIRPFKDIEEFRRTLGWAVGDTITYKKKDRDTEYSMLFSGYALAKDGDVLIYLGAKYYVLKELCDDYLYYRNGEWKPFGVEEDEA